MSGKVSKNRNSPAMSFCILLNYKRNEVEMSSRKKS